MQRIKNTILWLSIFIESYLWTLYHVVKILRSVYSTLKMLLQKYDSIILFLNPAKYFCFEISLHNKLFKCFSFYLFNSEFFYIFLKTVRNISITFYFAKKEKNNKFIKIKRTNEAVFGGFHLVYFYCCKNYCKTFTAVKIIFFIFYNGNFIYSVILFMKVWFKYDTWTILFFPYKSITLYIYCFIPLGKIFFMISFSTIQLSFILFIFSPLQFNYFQPSYAHVFKYLLKSCKFYTLHLLKYFILKV